MQTTFTYEGILRAVGRVLDESGVKSFSIRDDDDGLIIEGTNDAGEPQLHARYTVGDLYEMVTRDQEPEMSLGESETTTPTLQRFLAEHRRELIGAAR
jgi:hypothetical protein